MVDIRAWGSSFPPTRKLYEGDSYLRESNSTLLGYANEKGKRYYIVLSQTIFHPKAGGQGSDTGFIEWTGGQFRVEKALLIGGVVVHYGKLLAGSMPDEGAEVKLAIDWDARYKTMKLHTAGHILDYAVKTVYGRVVETLDAYHSPPEPYVVYHAEPPTLLELKDMERVANDVVAADLPVRAFYVRSSELERAVLNAPNMSRLPEADVYRVVAIEGVNAIPCTGTHVKRTSEVGRILIKAIEDLGGSFKLVYDTS